MPRASREQLTNLVALVGEFYVRDRRLEGAQREMHAALARDGEIPDAAVRSYLAALQRYFGGFEKEARSHLREVERRLAHAAQLQFNLTAERGVAARRVEITQGVLSRVAELRGE